MPYRADVYNVFIASPGDVPKEREAVRKMLVEWNYIHSRDRKQVLMPVGWETHSTPQMGNHPQDIINKHLLKDCDLLVAVFWTRIGSPTEKAISGSVEEIEEHIKSGKPAMLYFSSAPAVLDSVDRKQYDALKKFRESCQSRGLYASYDSLEDFREKFNRQLAQEVIRAFPTSPESISAPTASDKLAQPALSRNASELLCQIASMENGYLLRIKSDLGNSIWASGRTMNNPQDSRERAKWEAAFQELEQLGLIEDSGTDRKKFELTEKGFEELANISHNFDTLPVALSQDAQELLGKASNDGRIYRNFDMHNGYKIIVGGSAINELGNARSLARWDNALVELELAELISAVGDKRQAFQVTDKGFKAIPPNIE
ncbi:MAG: DUF4062 domain-containing protein [Planctomycetia bacterium]|nr:DUF4062 domain-containing protein [Planctomycetia bacterium]